MKNSPATQATNLIRHIGDAVYENGEPIRIMSLANVRNAAGASSNGFADQLMAEMVERGVIRMSNDIRPLGREVSFLGVNLTLDGWKEYEKEKRGQYVGDHGFIAMKFDDEDLDSFVRGTVKPAVKEGTGYNLVDMRDVARAGVIDNIMRVQIRDSAFLIADLTHDNPGAYWEAGYAEGLGKPVIYICERSKFEEKSTHFDTNHCTTIPWSINEAETFKKELIATLRRSLDSHD